MFIKISKTPNENVLRFSLNIPVGNGSFYDKDTPKPPALCTELFLIDGVNKVFLGSDFISVTKNDEVEWAYIKNLIVSVLVNEFSEVFKSLQGSNFPEKEAVGKKKKSRSHDSEFLNEVEKVIDSKIRPSLEADGGDMDIYDFADGVLKIKLLGACDGCPASAQTLKNGVERILKHYFKEITEIQEV